MRIDEIYKSYEIPPNLQEHMIKVASVGAWIVDHSDNQTELDKTAIIQALLLHDMGNIIKFDFSQPLMSDEETKRTEYWKAVQKRFQEKYGDEHIAATTIAKEINLNEKAFACLKAVGSAKAQAALTDPNFNHKIACYADFRISPHGVVTLTQRFDDIVKRYVGRAHELGKAEEIERRRTYCFQLEKQIQERVKIDLSLIDTHSIAQYLKEIESFEITS